MCNECDHKCGCQKEVIEKTKEKLSASGVNVRYAVMSQATYEAISGEVLTLCGLEVKIDNLMKDNQYLITGE